MTSLFPMMSRDTVPACLLVLLVLLIMSGGCTQPAFTQQQPQQQPAPSPVIASQPDNGHILITYPGSTATGTLLELEVTITDSTGITQTKSVGDRYSTTPLKFGATKTLTGSFSGKDHVLVTGYFMDSSKKLLLDTTI
ncbi:MAG TPA: hypothetical protein VLL74_05795 [Methanoregula sp.]|nr:hypothetical protein [Methanoregula sp.]